MNNIQRTFHGLTQSFRNYCSATLQTTMAVGVRFKELHNDTEFFYMACKVSAASLDLIMMHYPGAASLARLSFVVKGTATMQDFFRIVQHPREWFFPVNAKSINEFVALESLAIYLYRQYNEDVFDDEGIEKIDKEQLLQLSTIAKKCLKAQLQQMNATGAAYRNLDEFIQTLQKRLRKTNSDDFDFSYIDLSNLNERNPQYNLSQWVRHVPLIERMTNLDWLAVDIGSVVLCFQDWRLLDTTKWADRIGQYPVFQWVKNQHLETWFIGLICSAFAWKLLESVRKLSDEALTEQDKRQVRWNSVTALAELVFFGTIFLNLIGKTNVNNAYLQFLAIGAKSLGMLSIATRPTYKFFEEAAPAA